MPITDSTADIIGRIKYLIKQSRMTQAEFARRISVDPSNMSKHLSGRLPITDSLINRIVVDMGISKKWLMSGADVPFSKHSQIDEVTGTSLKSVKNGIPVYDIDVTAGGEELSSMFTVDRITGYVALPRLSSDSLIVHVSGDSMQPEIIDGGMVVIRPVAPGSPIIWGQVYVVVTDDFRRVKFLRRHPSDDSKVILHSANPNYDDMEVDRGDIKSLFRVEAILNCKICG